MRTLAATLALALAATSMATVSFDVEAKRLGKGSPAGMQRQMPQSTPDAPTRPGQTPAQSPTPAPGQGVNAAAPAAATGAAAAAQAGRRSWMAPLAGLAAGLGLAALFSHLGLGAELANFMLLLLMGVAAFFLVRWLMRRMAGGAARGPVPAMAGAAAGAAGGSAAQAWSRPAPEAAMARSALPDASTATPAAGAPASWAPAEAPAAAAARPALPEGMDADAFLRIAKQVFIRLQAANDAGDVEDLRRFTTPELFASLKADLLERGGAAQQTDVLQLEAAIADVSREQQQEVVSVRFWGLVREASDAGAEHFDELWHLVQRDDGQWLIAGITPQPAQA